MVGGHHQLDGQVEQVPGAGDGQGSLVCCSPRGPKESDTTERLNWLNGTFPHRLKITMSKMALFYLDMRTYIIKQLKFSSGELIEQSIFYINS